MARIRAVPFPGRGCKLRAKGSIREITGIHEARPGMGLSGEHEKEPKDTKGLRGIHLHSADRLCEHSRIAKKIYEKFIFFS
jgi:hypothetical protein